MPIRFNNVEIPESGGAIKFNGTDIEKVVHNNLVVWQKQLNDIFLPGRRDSSGGGNFFVLLGIQDRPFISQQQFGYNSSGQDGVLITYPYGGLIYEATNVDNFGFYRRTTINGLNQQAFVVTLTGNRANEINGKSTLRLERVNSSGTALQALNLSLSGLGQLISGADVTTPKGIRYYSNRIIPSSIAADYGFLNETVICWQRGLGSSQNLTFNFFAVEDFLQTIRNNSQRLKIRFV